MWCLGGFKKQCTKSFTPSLEKPFNVLYFKKTFERYKMLLCLPKILAICSPKNTSYYLSKMFVTRITFLPQAGKEIKTK